MMPRVLLVLLLLGTLPLRTAAAADERLAQAAAQADLQLVRKLLAARADVNAPDADGTTALHWAVSASPPGDGRGTASCRVRRPRSPNAFGVHSDLIPPGGTRQRADHPASAGCRRRRQHGADRSGDTLLMAAVRTGKLDAVQLLLERGANVNAAEPALGHTVLMWAVRDDKPPS